MTFLSPTNKGDFRWLFSGGWPAVMALINSLVCLGMFGIQQIEVHNGTIPPLGTIIPGTKQPLLHWQEWTSLTYGDFLGLMLIQVAFVHLWKYGVISRQQKIVMVSSAIVAAILLYVHQSRPLHKLDWTCPVQGHLSWAGYMHLLYFGANIGIAVLMHYHWLWTRNLNGVLLKIALIGMVTWYASFGTDMATGRVADLKLEKTETE